MTRRYPYLSHSVRCPSQPMANKGLFAKEKGKRILIVIISFKIFSSSYLHQCWHLLHIIEPIRRILHRISKTNAIFVEAECTDIVHNENYIVIKDVNPLEGPKPKDAKIYYDKLIVAIGSMPHTMGTKGVEENCLFLKEAADAWKIRTKIMDCFERASFPGQPIEEIKRLLSIVVVGGGPTGVEFAGEIYGIYITLSYLDYIYDDLVNTFPELIKHCTITLVQSADHLLNTYDSKIIDCNYLNDFKNKVTEKEFGRSGIKTLFGSRVTDVEQSKITVLNKADKKNYTLPFGMCLWATGVGARPLTKKFCDSIDEQKNNRAISTDAFLRACGVNNHNVYAIGDCSTISQTPLINHVVELFKEADVNGDNKLSIDELVTLVRHHVQKHPQLLSYVAVLKDKFKEFDVNHDGFLQLDEFRCLIEKIDSDLTTLPATAQVANQQGKYVAQCLNKLDSSHRATTTATNPKPADPNNNNGTADLMPFKYKHLGSFAYIGHRNAVADVPGAFSGGGFGVWWAYRSIYLEKQFSLKNRVLVTLDWWKAIFLTAVCIKRFIDLVNNNIKQLS
uniref:Calcium-binding EF-hand domain-containing protein n=1 Tax=Cavenderia deminutiva TaxID=361123 RepID=A0A1L2FV15_9MYCE|nr:calcium-binding EF-hand domain-containing protein [Cavenderia deminutiva]